MTNLILFNCRGSLKEQLKNLALVTGRKNDLQNNQLDGVKSYEDILADSIKHYGISELKVPKTVVVKTISMMFNRIYFNILMNNVSFKVAM